MKDRTISGAIKARLAALFGSSDETTSDQCTGCPDTEICHHATPCPLKGKNPQGDALTEEERGLLNTASVRRLSRAEVEALRLAITNLEGDLGAMSRAFLTVTQERAKLQEGEEGHTLRGEAGLPPGGMWIAGVYYESLDDYAQLEAGSLMNGLTLTRWPEDKGKRWRMQYEMVARYTARILSEVSAALAPGPGKSTTKKSGG